jgi:general stress protein 26
MKERLFQILRQDEDFLCALATVGMDGRPHVRYMRAVVRDDLTILCPTFAATQKVKDVMANGNVSLTCGNTDSGSPGSYFHITARATVSRLPTDRTDAWTNRLERWFSGPQDEAFVVLVIVPERIVACPIGGGPAAELWEKA